jgi:hypothetical protein
LKLLLLLLPSQRSLSFHLSKLLKTCSESSLKQRLWHWRDRRISLLHFLLLFLLPTHS